RSPEQRPEMPHLCRSPGGTSMLETSRLPRSLLGAVTLVSLSLVGPFADVVRAALPPPPAEWLSRVQSGIAASEYEITWQGDMFSAPNRAQNLRSHFTDRGVRIVPRQEQQPTWEWGLTLLRHGRPAELRTAHAAPLVPNGNRGERDRGDIVEWYVNDSRGLEQGFTLNARPPSSGD